MLVDLGQILLYDGDVHRDGLVAEAAGGIGIGGGGRFGCGRGIELFIAAQVFVEGGDGLAGLASHHAVRLVDQEAPHGQLVLNAIGDALRIHGIAGGDQICAVVQQVLGGAIGDAGLGEAVVALKGGHGGFRIGAVHAVGGIPQIAQLDQLVLQGDDVGGVVAVAVAALELRIAGGLCVLVDVVLGDILRFHRSFGDARIHHDFLRQGGRDPCGQLHAGQGKNQYSTQKSTQQSKTPLVILSQAAGECITAPLLFYHEKQCGICRKGDNFPNYGRSAVEPIHSR